MNTNSLKTRINKLEIANGSKLPLYIPVIWRFDEEPPPDVYRPDAIIKRFDGSVDVK